MDALQLYSAAHCLEKALINKKLNDVQSVPGGLFLDVGKDRLVIQIKHPPTGLWLNREAAAGEAHPFANLCRQTLTGMTCKGVSAPYPDRILRFQFERQHLSGRKDRFSLIAEWFGQQGNLVLLENGERMRYAWRWDDITAKTARILPQQDYRPPQRAQETLWFMAPRYRKDLNPEQEARLLAEFSTAAKACAPWRRLEKDGQTLLYPLSLPGWNDLGPADLLLDWSAYLHSQTSKQSEAPANHWKTRLNTWLEREAQALAHVEKDIARWQHPERYRRWGQALYTLPNHSPHQAEIEALDYHAQPPTRIHIPVHRDQPLHQQAEQYFKLARRAERGLAQALARQEQVRAQREHLQQLSQAWERQEISEGVLQAEFGLSAPAARGNKTQDRPGAAPLHIQIEGYEILVGRSARQNELLAFKIARPWDIWLHVQNHPGAHVLIRMPKQEKRPPDSVLEHAAALALRHSPKAGQAADVDWTLARFVSRKPGGTPGQVLYREFKTWRTSALRRPRTNDGK